MPYIKEDRRYAIEGYKWLPNTPGELNYVFNQLMIDYINMHGLSYQSINDCLGALEGAKSEFYRRVAVPYEEKKIVENGDLDWPK